MNNGFRYIGYREKYPVVGVWLYYSHDGRRSKVTERGIVSRLL